MNRNERRESSYFPKAIDKAIKERFGEDTEATTELNFLDGNYVTYFKAEGQKKLDIETFIAGYLAGNMELRERLYQLSFTKTS